MSLSIPVYFCVLKDESITPQGNYATRIIQSIKCEFGDVDRLYAEYNGCLFNNMGWYIKIFAREPDEAPMENKINKDDELRQSILDLQNTVALLERRLNQELKWKDQLAEDNRLLREKLDIPDSHFKYTEKDVSKWMDDNFAAESQETREHPFEYKDW